MKTFLVAALLAAFTVSAWADNPAHTDAVARNGEWIDVEDRAVNLTITDTAFGGGNTSCNFDTITFSPQYQTYTVKAQCQNASRHEAVLEYWHFVYTGQDTLLVRIDATKRGHNPPVTTVYKKGR